MEFVVKYKVVNLVLVLLVDSFFLFKKFFSVFNFYELNVFKENV